MGREKTFADNVRLISTTDLEGIITYANPEFCDVAGFTADELIGQPHNIVRHAEMPSAAFADLWAYANANKPWMGMVKNRCKNGDYYWVRAYVTPLFDDKGSKVGYQSVRTSPDREEIDRAERVYRKISKKNIKLRGVSLQKRLINAAMLAFFLCIGSLFIPLPAYLQALIQAVIGGGFVAFLFKQLSPLSALRNKSLNIYENPLAQYVMAGNMSEIGMAELGLMMQEARLRTVIGRVEDSIATLNRFMAETKHAIEQTRVGIDQQNVETDMLASAATQMSATAHEIAENTSQTSHATIQTSELAENGKGIVAGMVEGIHTLVEEVKNAGAFSEELRVKALEVEKVVNIINEIAEQTNLLALNAAIEAARAGDQGRGFSVVADEVRVLAQRTQDSTNEIRATIDAIQNQVGKTVDSMKSCSVHAASNIERAGNVGSSFENVNGAMADITDRSAQVAAASEQQSAVAEEVSKNIITIREVASENSLIAQKMQQSSADLEKLMGDLKSMLKAI